MSITEVGTSNTSHGAEYCLTLPPVRDHMIMNVTSVTFNSTLTFSCIPGYELDGNDTMVCGEGGLWEGGEPTCGGISHIAIVYLKSNND